MKIPLADIILDETIYPWEKIDHKRVGIFAENIRDGLIFDPMGGGGVTPDVCLAFHRKCRTLDMGIGRIPGRKLNPTIGICKAKIFRKCSRPEKNRTLSFLIPLTLARL